jgi:predicted RNase H-like HicB family nuclease
MKFNVTIDRDEDGIWILEYPSISGCVSQGQTKDHSLANITDAIIVVFRSDAIALSKLPNRH